MRAPNSLPHLAGSSLHDSAPPHRRSAAALGAATLGGGGGAGAASGCGDADLGLLEEGPEPASVK